MDSQNGERQCSAERMEEKGQLQYKIKRSKMCTCKFGCETLRVRKSLRGAVQIKTENRSYTDFR